jgi:hypothetical protein
MTQPGQLPQLPSPRIPKALLLNVVRLASGVPAAWVTDKWPAFPQDPGFERARIIVSPGAYANVAIDELLLTWNPATNRNDVVTAAHRLLTLSLKAQSLDDTLEAIDLLERVRARLRTERIQTLWRPTVALQDIKPIVPLGNQWADSVAMPTAVMDVRFKLALAFVNLDPYEGDWIEADSDSAAIWAGNGTLLP